MSDHKSINDADALLLFSVGPVLVCAPTLSVVSVLLPPVLHKPPGSDANHPGVFRHSCGMVSVVDLRQRFGVDAKDWRQPGCMVVTEISGGHAGFWVDEVLDVTQWPQHGWGKLPALVPRRMFKQTLLRAADIFLYADFEELYLCKQSGYLREHIAQIKQKQAASVPVPQIANTAADASQNRVSQPHHVVQQPEFQPVTHNTSSNTPAVTRPVVPMNISQRVDKPTPAKKIQPINVSAKTISMVASHHKPVAMEDVSSITQNSLQHNALTATQKIAERIAQQQPGQIINNPDSSSRYLVAAVSALFVGIAVIIIYSLTNTPMPAMKPVTEFTVVQQTQTPPSSHEVGQHNAYQASIAHDNEGIVIVVDEEVEDEKNLAMQEPVPVPAAQPDVTTAQKLPGNEKIIIHVVVKGDTLWAIANQYVRDPWRYPELARLSSIKNPHRIYPGNKVKIIKRITTKKKPER